MSTLSYVYALKITHMSSPRDILGVDLTASQKEIKSAYRRASLKTHPDVKGGSKEAFNKVNDAYNSLINSNNNNSNSRANPYGRQTHHQGDGTYRGETTHFGSRAAAATFHTPNPYRHKTASSIRGTQQMGGTYHFDERINGNGATLRTKRLRSGVLKHSQRKHTRANLWVCTIPFVAAWALYEINLEQKHRKRIATSQRHRR